jgi:hypothetical protein
MKSQMIRVISSPSISTTGLATLILVMVNELGLLPKIKRISSVSGGALTAAALAAGWSELTFDGQGRGHQGLSGILCVGP